MRLEHERRSAEQSSKRFHSKTCKDLLGKVILNKTQRGLRGNSMELLGKRESVLKCVLHPIIQQYLQGLRKLFCKLTRG